MTFGVADNVFSQFSQAVADGILGVMTTANTTAPLYQVLTQLDKPIITIYTNA